MGPLLIQARFIAYNSSNTGWRPDSVRTRWGSLSAAPDPLATIGGLLLRGGEGKGRENESRGHEERRGGKGGVGKGREGKGREGRRGEMKEGEGRPL